MRHLPMALLLLGVLSAAAPAAPVTEFEHPMITDTANWDRDRPDPEQLQSLLDLTDDELRACVPFQTPRIYSLCPCCSQKENGRDYRRRHYPGGVFDFDPKKPWQITCTTCGEVFPDNPKFPQTHTRRFNAPRMWAGLNKGDVVTVRWHQQTRPPRDPAELKPGEDGTWTAYFYMDGALDTRRDVFCQEAMKTLTKAYYYYTHNQENRDPDTAYRCAWKTAVLLDGYANALPRWLLCDNYGKDYFNCGDKGDFPYGWSETRYGGARQTAEQNGPGFYRNALDVTCESRAFKDYGKQAGPSDYEHLFVKEGRKPPAEYALPFYDKLCRNVLMPVRRYQGSVLGKWGQGCPINGTQGYAMLTHNREMLRLAAQSMFVFPQRSFFVDGGYSEGSGYSGIHLLHTHKGLWVQRGYTDPPDYEVPNDSPNRAFWEEMCPSEDMPYLGRLVDYNALNPDRARDEGKEMALQSPADPRPPPHVSLPLSRYPRFWRRAFNVWKDITAPNGGQYALAEDGHRNLGSYQHVMTEPRHVTTHVLKTGMKRFLLGDGEGDDQVQINLAAGLYTAHGRTNFLDLQIFDNGHYMADGFGYGKHQMRGRYNSLQAMNTAGVDTFKTPSNNGIPLMYESNIPGVALVRVGTHRETEGVKRFERTVALVSTDIKHPYIVDLFYIQGQGDPDTCRRREYFFHSTKHHDQTSTVSLPMQKLPGERGLLELEGIEWNERMVDGRGYGVFFDAREGDASQSFTVDFEVVDPWKPLMWNFDPKKPNSKPVEIKGKTPNSALPMKARDDSWADEPAIGLRRHIVGFPDLKAYSYTMPHPNKLHKNTQSAGWGRMPAFLVRHDVEDTAEETEFLVVHEAWAGKPYITGVKRLPAENGSRNAVALEITMPGRTDIIVLSNDGNEAVYKGHGIDFQGRFGIVATTGPKTDAALIGGTRLSGPDTDLAMPADIYAGTIIASEREWRGEEDGFYVDTELPRSLVGSWMMVNVRGPSMRRKEKGDEEAAVIGAGWAFRIAKIRKKNGKTFVVTADEHGLEVGNGTCREFFKPHNHIRGETRFQVYPVLSNQGLVRVTPAGGPQAGPVDVTMEAQAGVPGARIEYLTVPIDAPPVYSVDDGTLAWQTYARPVTIDSDCRLLVRAIPRRGIKVPVAQRLEFTMPPEPVEIADSAKLNPLPVTVKRYYKGENSNIEEPEVRMFYRREGERDTGCHVNGLGLLRIATTGKYTFHFHSRRGGRLVIGGQTIFDGSFPAGLVGSCYLKPGYYPFEFVSEGALEFDFEWQGPGIERRSFQEEDLCHRQALLNAYRHEFKTQKIMR